MKKNSRVIKNFIYNTAYELLRLFAPLITEPCVLLLKLIKLLLNNKSRFKSIVVCGWNCIHEYQVFAFSCSNTRRSENKTYKV